MHAKRMLPPELHRILGRPVARAYTDFPIAEALARKAGLQIEYEPTSAGIHAAVIQARAELRRLAREHKGITSSEDRKVLRKLIAIADWLAKVHAPPGKN